MQLALPVISVHTANSQTVKRRVHKRVHNTLDTDNYTSYNVRFLKLFMDFCARFTIDKGDNRRQ